jgi:hypothetical protein
VGRRRVLVSMARERKRVRGVGKGKKERVWRSTLPKYMGGCIR